MCVYHGEGTYEMDATGWLLPRATDELVKPINGTAATAFRAASSASQNSTSTQMLLNDFRFAAAKSIRTSTIILAIFNAIAAFATVLGILWDNYSRAKRSRGFSIRRDGLNFVQGPEVYPLFLSMAIMVQGIIFAGVQGHGLDGLFTSGCASIAQSMLPALFLVPATQAIFGLETTIRGLRSRPFPKRHPWAVRICLFLVVVAFLVGFLVAYIARTPFNFCFASLFWFIAHYSLGCFVVLLAISVILTISAFIIFWRLSRSVCVEATERVSASRMVYYLVLAIISNTLMLPFFFHMAFYDQRDERFQGLTLSMVAAVVAEVSGLMTGGLHLFLRSSSTISSIGPKNKTDLKHSIRRGPSNATDPHDDRRALTSASPTGLRRMDSDASAASLGKDEEAGLSPPKRGTTKGLVNPLRANAVYPRPPEPSHMSVWSQASRRTTNVFSMFRPGSSKSGTGSTTLLPATTYSPNTAAKPARFDFSSLKPPPSMKNLGSRGHRRDSSIESHITVQLGLRLSNMDDGLPMGARQSCESTIPMMDQTREPPQKWVPKPSPLVMATRRPSEADSASSRPGTASGSDSDVEDDMALDTSPARDPADNVRMKTLPPVPASFQPAGAAASVAPPTTLPSMAHRRIESGGGGGGETLSPTVYSPQSSRTPTAPASAPSPTVVKTPSPRGVGFASPMSRYNSTSQRSPPPRKASVVTANTAALPPPTSDKGSDWI